MSASIHALKDGDKVTGRYCGQTFTGVIASHRPHTMNHHIELFFVDLDAPITVFGDTRMWAHLSLSDDAAAQNHYHSGHCDDFLKAVHA
jgi:hypothetical protein